MLMVNLLGPMISYFYFQLLFQEQECLFQACLSMNLYFQVNLQLSLPHHWIFFLSGIFIKPSICYVFGCYLSNKLLGLLAQIYVSAVMLLILLVENTSHYQNPFRRPVCSGLVMYIIEDSLWLSLGPISVILVALPFWQLTTCYIGIQMCIYTA